MGRTLILCFMFIINSLRVFSQDSLIKKELESYIFGGCNKQVDINLLNQNAIYSARFLNKIRTDTLKCIEKKKIETTCLLFNISEQKKEIFNFLLEYLSDSSIRYSGYIANCIYEKIHELDLSETETKKIRTFFLEKPYSRNLSLLLAYLDFYDSAPCMIEWLKKENLKNSDKEIINVSLARLNNEIALKNILNFNIVKESDWMLYFRYLNYIRQSVTTKKLIDFLDNNKEITLEELPDVNSSIKCKLSALSLYHLSMIIVDFPIEIKYMDLYRDLSIETEETKKWLMQHFDFQINRRLGRFKL